MPPAKTRLPAIEGWFTLDEHAPALLGSRCTACGNFAFPKETFFCRNPECQGTEFAETELSRTGKVWSFTDACYQPPKPYEAAVPYVPFAIAAVELACASTPSSSPASTAAMTVSIVWTSLSFLPTAIAALPFSNSIGFAP